MFKLPEQFATANKTNTEALLNLANTAFAGMERLAALNLNAARALVSFELMETVVVEYAVELVDSRRPVGKRWETRCFIAFSTVCP